MKAEDLMIGNYLDLNGPVKVVGITSKEFIDSPHNTLKDDQELVLKQISGNSCFTCNCDHEDLKGIPLMWHHLKSHGAIQLITERGIYLYSRFRLVWREEYNYWYVIEPAKEAYMTKIEFVHEWQNFIRWTDGVELKIDVK